VTGRNGPWDSPTTEQDKQADLTGDDPPTVRANDAYRAKARAATADVVMLDRVSGNMPADHAPRRSESAAGGIVVVATGNDAERVRKLCHARGLLVPVMSSLAVVHDAMSIVVIGEPSPPAPERVVHVVRPTLGDDQLIDLLRALASGRAVVDPPSPTDHPAAREAARRVAAYTDRAAIEHTVVDELITLTAADRAHCLFHDPATGALWSEAKRRTSDDDRRAMGGLVGWAAQTGKMLHASPAGDDPRWLQELDDPDGKAQSRLLVQPIVGADRRVHAVLVAVRRWRNTDFSDAEITALAAFAALAGPALDLAVGSSAEPRRPRTTQPLGAASKSALAASPRQASDSRPPPVTAQRSAGDTRPPQTNRKAITAQQPIAGKPPAGDIVPIVEDATRVDDSPGPEERYSSESIQSLPSPPTMPPSSSYVAKPPRARTKAPSDSPKPRRDGEPRDLAVIASDDDAKRVQRIAKKLRLELATFPALADAPEFYQVVMLGETFAGDDSRVAYAARSSISDDALGDLLTALIHDRAVVPALPLARPQTTAEARRSQVAIAGARNLAAATEFAAAEAVVLTTIKELLDTDRAYYWLVDPMTGALSSAKETGPANRRAIAGISGWVARTGRAVAVPRASADPRWLAPLDDPDGDPHSQLLVQPIVRGDQRVYGVLIAARRARRPGFTDTDASLLARFATLAAPLLEQLAVAHDTQQMVGEDTSTHAPVAEATESTLALIVRGKHPLARWIYLAIGVIAGVLAGILAG
jgi:GAF domain-containing protein